MADTSVLDNAEKRTLPHPAMPGSPLTARQRAYLAGRRAQDIVLSLLALVVLAPLMLLIALAIVLDSPGASPIFAQQRVGRGGRLFRLLKFRTMCPKAEERLEELLPQNQMDGPVFKIKGDPRITRVGRFLRKTSLDELPQLVNVLKGDEHHRPAARPAARSGAVHRSPMAAPERDAGALLLLAGNAPPQ